MRAAHALCVSLHAPVLACMNMHYVYTKLMHCASILACHAYCDVADTLTSKRIHMQPHMGLDHSSTQRMRLCQRPLALERACMQNHRVHAPVMQVPPAVMETFPSTATSLVRHTPWSSDCKRQPKVAVGRWSAMVGTGSVGLSFWMGKRAVHAGAVA